MKKVILSLVLANYILANDGYVPLNSLSNEEKSNYNFINKSEKNFEVIPLENRKKTIKESLKKEEQIIENEAILEEPKPTYETVKNEDIKEYKKDAVLQNTKRDFSFGVKAQYFYVDSKIDKNSVEKTHEFHPEISATYKNSTLKADYLDTKAKDDSVKIDTKWFRIAYLYKFYNASLGLGINNYQVKIDNEKLDRTFPSLEVHIENSVDEIVFNYGGFYGKSGNSIKNAYEYYASLGYRPFLNNNLIFLAGYKNRTVEIEKSNLKDKIHYKGPILGLSSSF